MKKMKATTKLRIIAGCHRNDTFPPIVVDDSDSHPHIEGEGWSWRTRGGRIIRHPTSYARVGWSNMVYSPSNRRIVVGKKWIEEKHPELFEQLQHEPSYRAKWT
jgi:hypothetical protein